MKKVLFIVVLVLACLSGSAVSAFGAMGWGCGTLCLAEMRSYCPTCYANMNYSYGRGYATTPWGGPSPYWWNTGPIMYSNFYSPAPWAMGPMMSGVMPSYYPGGGPYFGAKPNLYILGPSGTQVSVKIHFREEGDNWLATVPAHGEEGWKGTISDGIRFRSGGSTYSYLFSDYRVYGRNFQDEAGFCTDRNGVLGRMASTLNEAGFSGREITHFLAYWSVKMPPSNRFCVYPQDERQLDAIVELEITPRPATVRRLLFMVQVGEAMGKKGEKFSAAPKKSWTPQPLRMPASDSKAIVAREWGVGFIAAKP